MSAPTYAPRHVGVGLTRTPFAPDRGIGGMTSVVSLLGVEVGIVNRRPTLDGFTYQAWPIAGALSVYRGTHLAAAFDALVDKHREAQGATP